MNTRTLTASSTLPRNGVGKVVAAVIDRNPGQGKRNPAATLTATLAAVFAGRYFSKCMS